MDNSVGERILELIKKKNITQKELAEECDVTEVSMSRYVTGVRIPKAPIVAKMAKALGTTSDYILQTEKELDFESEYYRLHRTIARMASKMTMKQRRDLINAILADEDEQ